jgi:serine/threonine-protein kinase RsbW
MDKMYESGSIGIGIKIISQIADELSYTYTDNRRNCLKIVKYFQPALPQHNNRSKDVLNIFNWLKVQQTNKSDRTSQKPFHKITLQLASEIATVTQVLWWIEQLDDLPISQGVLQLCKLAAVEGFIIAIHNHKNMPSDTPIDLAIEVFNDRLEMKIWDWGKPFNFQAKLKKEWAQKDPFGLQELGFAVS